MGKSKSKGKQGGSSSSSSSDKKSSASSAAKKCACDHPYRCSCGNRPERPSKGHKWDPPTQAWGGKGHKQKGASGQAAVAGVEAAVTSAGNTSLKQWQKLPSRLLSDLVRRNGKSLGRGAPIYRPVNNGKGKAGAGGGAAAAAGYRYRSNMLDCKELLPTCNPLGYSTCRQHKEHDRNQQLRYQITRSLIRCYYVPMDVCVPTLS